MPPPARPGERTVVEPRMRLPSACWCAALGLLLGVLPAPAQQRAGAAQPERPSLVVLLTIDQLRADYLDRFGQDFTGGFARLVQQGTVFTEVWHDHAMTSTAPGHATLWSGRFPRHHGIISNDLGVPDTRYPLIGGARGPGASPRRFVGSALYDWLRAADPGAGMLAVSRKDRGAILSVGRARAATFWWAEPGMFTTSAYYADALPDWVSAWNERFARGAWEGRVWTLALPPSAYPEPDEQPWEGLLDRRGNTFPHRMDSVRELIDFPWMDSLTLELALTGARAMELGGGPGPDLLAVSLSTLDAIGHDFGPDSREVHDHVVHLDRWLGAFMTELERELPDGSVLYVLSSDHGIGSMPEMPDVEGNPRGGRIDLAGALLRIADPVVERHGLDFGMLLQDGLALADTASLRAAGEDVDELAERLADAFADLPGVERAYTPSSLAVAPPEDPDAGAWRRSIPPGYAWLAAVDAEPGWMLGRGPSAGHGTPLPVDRIVPVVFHGPGIAAARVERPARTVDVAPTVAALLGVDPTEPVDGSVLEEVGSRAEP